MDRRRDDEMNQWVHLFSPLSHLPFQDEDIPIVPAEVMEDDPNPDFAANPPAYAPGVSVPPSASIASSTIASNTASCQHSKPPGTTTTTTTTYSVPAPAAMAARIQTYLGR
jgi:hypothetical protein